MECSTLLDLLSQYSLVLHQISPYLSIASLLNLAATSKAFRSLLYSSKEAFRYIDLSTATGACVTIPPIDRGGFNWRNERIDESTTEEDFYSGPIRGIFSFLQRKKVLAFIQVLVLDHVSAPAEVLREIICEEHYHVRILSVIGSTNLNTKKLQQTLCYAVRPTRSPGTPKLKGLYFFGVNERPSLDNLIAPASNGVTDSPGAQLGAALNRKSHSALQSSGLAAHVNPWYRNSGRVLAQSVAQLNDWAMTLKECQDVIYFDAILCHGPRHDAMSSMVPANTKDFLGPRIATIALRGCETCHTIPENAVRSSQAPSSRLPLLSPLPRHSSSIKNAQQPPQTLQSSTDPHQHDQLLFARCTDCTFDRWCEGCGKFWCEDHYHIQDLHRTQQPEISGSSNSNKSTSRLKVHLGLCIEKCLVMELLSGSSSDGMWG
ncbi:MAG: hypothetical protein GOMPHAMPRED_002553 [Gomphillus americanus]|uniref:F-box domain-containing protein n=1 Tax=Gomphillus americanus TaxID=1940652 RepID=A0A8H3FDK1_9LECA|nr:MAG: hypothetical protein GOMPHAMPRED_002553 [Gomphillus americanus]